MSEQITIAKAECGVPLFQINGVLKNDALEEIKENLKQQAKSGVIIIDGKINFLGFVPQFE